MTQSEILNLYKTAANQVKNMSSGVSVTFIDETYNQVGSGDPPALVKTFFPTGTKAKNKTYNKQSDIQKNFVVEKESYVCALTDADIISATITESGSNKIITIRVKDDTNDSQNYSNKAISSSALASVAGTFTGGMTIKCSNVSVKATLDSSNRLIALTTNGQYNFAKGSDAFSMSQVQNWSISY